MGQNKYLITTLVIGQEIESLAKQTVPGMEQYAKRVGADFKVIGKTEISERLTPYYEKNQIFNFLDEYDKVLFIDSDILITPDAPNLFRQCNGDEIAAVSVEDVYGAVEKEKAMLQQFLGETEWTKKYFNSGVVMFTRKYRDLLNTSDGLIEKWVEGKAQAGVTGLNDQSVFNYRVNKHNIPIVYLDKAFNFTKAWGCFHKRFAKFFIHYAGMKGNREFRIKFDNRVIKSGVLYPIFKRFPVLVKFVDAVVLRIFR